MSLESVRRFLAATAPDLAIIELNVSTATVAQAARAHGVAAAEIAKTLSLRVGARVILLVTCGDLRLDNGKAKRSFGGTVKMLRGDEVETATGHPIGGVCPFGIPLSLPVFCDRSLLAFDDVVVAAGSPHGSVRIAPRRMAELVHAEWVDVCKAS